jgi:hypothetical protein
MPMAFMVGAAPPGMMRARGSGAAQRGHRERTAIADASSKAVGKRNAESDQISFPTAHSRFSA